MELILWRHAQAQDLTDDMPAEADMQRPLTAKGQKQAQRMGGWLESALPQTCRILVSPSLRTQETAEALGRKFKTLAEIGPAASAEDLILAANWPHSREPVLLIGHQPALGAMAAQLIKPQQSECAIRKANVWWISQKEMDGEGLQTYLKAIMCPQLA